MPTKVFATGATGYVGGDALHILFQTYPDWHYTLLARDPTRLGSLTSEHPSIRVVKGDLNSLELLKSEAATADIVFHFASSDDVPAAQAILDGLGSQSKTCFLIHTSGTANLLWDDITSNSIGKKATKIYDDIEDIKSITSFPDAVPHRPVDKLVLEASTKYPNVKTAIVCPPGILGVGRGTGNKRTIQLPMFIELSRKRGKAYQVESGESAWSFVHVHDLADVYFRLAEAAAAGGGKADWGSEAYYFAESGALQWGHIARVVAKHLHEAGASNTDEVDVLNAEQAAELHPLIPWSSGMNSISRASRARKVLGWEPKVVDFSDSLKESVEYDLQAKQTRMEEIAQGHFPGLAKE
ncbi:NAD(P)-binding protein [Bimuria novae-zelandiae CBS 107.79]|uniref:NAD(P)-binding protein n=1 Tax=Bimuria novae-zelandiae CBS 107.79 TaxID=1447943 RepID=A0A6A5UTR8_9PLEO|nr:NAD(P)-binding protein [Bimuria novae-zelandiae CBS 107.79]